jgi:hypothetical protein
LVGIIVGVATGGVTPGDSGIELQPAMASTTALSLTAKRNEYESCMVSLASIDAYSLAPNPSANLTGNLRFPDI